MRLADVFARAGEAGAVMLFDEADALLGARACHGPWAGVQRELLDHMDACEGIVLVASRYDGLLDLAALRRFDLKVRFGYLREEDAWTLFNDLAHSLGLSAETVTPHEVGGLGRLAPGDFAAVRRQSLLHPIRDARDLYRRLRAECAFKPPADGRRAVAYAGGPAQ
ncbi:AAA family ATPase [Achromobacter sp. DMS1]|uniref:AAA family ATPase n=1 Tax=Achromobacter sp. DMS1 TaxID=1688405 RepID=UPI00350EDBCD